MSLFFGNQTTMITTVLLIGMVCYIGWLIGCSKRIQKWGRHILLLAAYGLWICCYAATRDGLHLTIQHAIDGSCQPGLFPLFSFPTIIGAIGATLVIVSGLVSLFVRNQALKRRLCFITIAGILLKIVVIECCRLFM